MAGFEDILSQTHHRPFAIPTGKEWALKEVDIKWLRLNYQIGNIPLADQPQLAHYSSGVQVLAWRKIKIL